MWRESFSRFFKSSKKFFLRYDVEKEQKLALETTVLTETYTVF